MENRQILEVNIRKPKTEQHANLKNTIQNWYDMLHKVDGLIIGNYSIGKQIQGELFSDSSTSLTDK